MQREQAPWSARASRFGVAATVSRKRRFCFLSALVTACLCGAIPPVSAAHPASGPSAASVPPEPLPGLISAPRSLPAVGRWQLARVTRAAVTLAVAWNGDGTQIAFSDETYIRLCDAQSLETKAILAGHSYPVTSLAWNGHTNRIASASCDGTVRIWSSGRAGKSAPSRRRGNEIGRLDQGRIASGGRLAKGDCVRLEGGRIGRPNHSSLQRACQLGRLEPRPVKAHHRKRRWTGEAVGRRRKVAASLRGARQSRDGRRLESRRPILCVIGLRRKGAEHGTAPVGTANLQSGRIDCGDQHGRSANAGITWSPDSQRIAIYETEQNLRICDLKGMNLTNVPLSANGLDQPNGIAWAPKGQEIALGALGLVTVVNLTDRSFRNSPVGWQGSSASHPMPMAVPSPSTDQWLVRLSNDEPYRIWSAVDGNPGKAPPLEGSRSLSKAAWSPAGDQIAFVESGERLSGGAWGRRPCRSC